MKKYAVISLILTVLCLKGFACTGVFAENYNDRYDKLIKLEMIDERAEKDGVISRGEFCGILLRYLDIPVAGGLRQTEFTDVPVNSEYFSEIMTAYQNGLAFGSENRMFYPDEPIKQQDVCVMLIRALGYDNYRNFSSYNEYASLAANLGIIDGVSLNMNAFLDYSSLLVILDNCLDAKILYGVSTFGDKVDISECETLLEYKKGIKEYNGIVTSNRFSSLADASDASGEGKIGIDGVFYDIDGNYDGWLGYDVDFYLNGDDKIVYIEKTKKNNEMLLIKEDIKSITNDAIEYYINDKSKSKKVKIAAKYVLFNDEAISGYGKLSDIEQNGGCIRLLDCNNDNVYETVFFYEYGEYIVGSVNIEDSVIYDKISNTQIKLDQSKDAVIEIYNSDMEIIDLSELKEYDVLDVLMNDSGSGRCTRVYVTRNTVSGNIDETDDEEGTVIIDGESVNVTDICRAMLSIGDEGTLYTNIFGTGIYFEKNTKTDGYIYGILLWDNVNDDAFDRQEGFYLTLFSSVGETETYKLAETVHLNGKNKTMTKQKAFENVAAALEEGELIQYKVGDGIITEINTAYSQGSGGNEVAFRLKTSGSSFYYNDTMLNGELYMDGKTALFNISSNGGKSDKYSVMAYNDLRAGYNYTAPYKAYTFGDKNSFYAVAVILTDWKCETYFDNSNVAVVEKCKLVYDDYESETRARIYFTETMLGSEYTLAKGLESAKDIVKKGDIIRYQTNSKKEISRITIVMRADRLKGEYTDLYVDGNGNFAKSGDGALIYPDEPITDAVWLASGNGASMTRDNDVFYCNFKVVYATVKDIQGNYVVYSVNYESGGTVKTREYVAHANQTTYCTDTRDDEIKSMTLADVTPGDRIVMQMYSGTIRRLIVLD